MDNLTDFNKYDQNSEKQVPTGRNYNPDCYKFSFNSEMTDYFPMA